MIIEKLEPKAAIKITAEEAEKLGIDLERPDGKLFACPKLWGQRPQFSKTVSQNSKSTESQGTCETWYTQEPRTYISARRFGLW